MNIGIYGNSICEWNRVQDFSFIKKLEDFYSANIIHTGTTMCSEERILFDLKKTKNLDLAIIFHAKAKWIYIPSWHRDIESLDRYTIIKKIHSFPGYSEGYTFDNTEGESSILATRRWYQDYIGETKCITRPIKSHSLGFITDIGTIRISVMIIMPSITQTY
jgi:hypothetical protein